jgi:hypothetical protein
MTTVVRVKHGSYRNAPVVNGVFKMVKDYHVGAKGAYITVKNEGHFPIGISEVKIKVENQSAIEYVGSSGATLPAKSEKPLETDEQAMNRIATRFEILDQMAAATIRGDIRAVIVTGPPGVGKSHGVLEQMNKESMFDKLSERKPRFEVVKGAISGIGLFALLYKYSDHKNVLIFDDCDIWADPDALNVLKGALDSGKKRRISWNKDSRILRDEGIPNSFDFNGSVIFITNIDVANNNKRNTIKAHIEALQSRAHYLDLTIETERDKMLRVKQVHRDADGGLFADHAISPEAGEEVLEFMESNMSGLREISLRMALKIADLVKVSDTNWKMLAESTCMKRV